MVRVGLTWHGLEGRLLATSTPALLPANRENGAADRSRTCQILLTMEALSHESSDGQSRKPVPKDGGLAVCSVGVEPTPLRFQRSATTGSASSTRRDETRRDTVGAAEWSRTTLDPSTKRVLSHESDDGNQRRITAPRRQRLLSATKGSLPRRLIESTAHDRNAESLTRRTDEAH